MSATNLSFEHGEHNEKACEYLSITQDYPDWVITTAFYASLHFVTSKIFPFQYTAGGTTLSFGDISEWQKFKNYMSNKRHELIKDLVGVHCSKIASEYEWLLSSSMNARYHNYSHPKEVVNLSKNYMAKIKRECTPQAQP